ncbi:MBL fold metallo-hydrolase [Spongiactinospora gelatinilytica]|uniref:MBL fold metallo-hydrolase n=1 Tax=Spongiactinospora gelatinilytica TaxID=2666298 RepID=A0A2W2H0Z6_9ACTN|nr:MBL fold metallo-hydrolase [Spongiactinospora gelatinilytica]PZG55686.1 MBL fold metallo-hydrolase [Spongiactinospora gelatinilytica]
MSKPFASTADTEEKPEILEVLADGVYALTTGGDPNVGAIEGEDFLVCFEARATPVMARRWLEQLREHTDKPVRYLVLSHYHAVRVLGAAGFDAQEIITHTETRRLITERGKEDWDVEFGRMPRLFAGHETIPGLTWPTVTFDDHLSIELGGDRGTVELAWGGNGHTSGDIYAYVPKSKVLFAGDLVENGSAVYTGDAYHQEWMTTTLDRVKALDVDILVGGRGEIAHGRAASQRAIELTREFLSTLMGAVQKIKTRGGTVEQAYVAAREALLPVYGGMPVFEHAMVFDTWRAWEELDGSGPGIWTPQRDREVWDRLTG